jgi:hypothetical protein
MVSGDVKIVEIDQLGDLQWNAPTQVILAQIQRK